MDITVLTAGARKEGAALAASLPPEIESSTNYEIALSGDGADTTGRGNFSNIRPVIRRAQFLPPAASNNILQ
jgi:hypothetical protein